MHSVTKTCFWPFNVWLNPNAALNPIAALKCAAMVFIIHYWKLVEKIFGFRIIGGYMDKNSWITESEALDELIAQKGCRTFQPQTFWPWTVQPKRLNHEFFNHELFNHELFKHELFNHELFNHELFNNDLFNL